ncbi:MAG TPA: hypothetical protein VIH90_04320 [Candidatus Saccharimonadales bacterium]
MSSFEDSGHLELEDYLELLPEGCRSCPFALEYIGITLAFEASTGGPNPIVRDIHENCTGWHGPIVPSSGPEGIETDMGLMTMFPSHDGQEENCPYRMLDN